MLAPAPRRTLVQRVLDVVRPPAARPFVEMGESGTTHFGGYVQTREKSPDWTAGLKYTTIADMVVNASIVAAGVHYFVNLVAHPRWSVKAADDSPEAEAAAELVEEVINDMDQPWSRVVRRAAMYKFYGFGVQEWTARKRPDGQVGLASVEPRPQATIEKWAIADSGAVEGVWQRSVNSAQLLGIPRSKMLYLVDDTLSDSPEGLGIFRHLAEPWKRLQRFYKLEAMAFERDLRGIPIGRVPYSLLNQAVKAGDITSDEAEKLTKSMEDFVKLAAKETDTALTLDSAPYASQAADGDKVAGVMQWGVELLKGDGGGLAPLDKAITRTQFEMARILTCEHLMMGEGSGNRSLGEDKSRNLYLVANSVLSDIKAGVDRDVVWSVCLLNNIPEELTPTCEVEDVAFKDAEFVASTLAKMAQAGAVLSPDDPVIDDVRELMGVSKPSPVSPEMMGVGGGEEDAPPPEEDLGITLDDGADAGGGPVAKAFDPAQARDKAGKWTAAGGTTDQLSAREATALHGSVNSGEVADLADEISSLHDDLVAQTEELKSLESAADSADAEAKADAEAEAVDAQREAAQRATELHAKIKELHERTTNMLAEYEHLLAEAGVGSHAATTKGAVAKANPNHKPAGSPEGGQFTSGPGSGGDDKALLSRWTSPQLSAAEFEALRTDPKMDALLRTLPLYSGVVYRGATGTAGFVNGLEEGGAVSITKHSSSSTVRSVAESFAASHGGRARGVLMIMSVRGGRRVPSRYATVDGEREVIIPRATSFKITGVNRGGPMTIVRMKEV